MNNSTLDPRIDITEAKALLNAAWNTTSDERHYQLIQWARDLLKPHIEAKIPEALWLFCSMPKDNSEQISDIEFDRKHMIEVRTAAEAGSASAKFYLACRLDHQSAYEESTILFREAAEQGHTYSKWCYGLNLLSGRGTEKNEELGLRFIQEAGQEKFEGAIQFLSHAYANGTYGFPKDEGLAAAWWAMLKNKDLIRY